MMTAKCWFSPEWILPLDSKESNSISRSKNHVAVKHRVWDHDHDCDRHPSPRRPKQIHEGGIRALPSWRGSSGRHHLGEPFVTAQCSKEIVPVFGHGGSAAPRHRFDIEERGSRSRHIVGHVQHTSRSIQTGLLARLWYTAGGHKRLHIQGGTAVPAGLVHTGIGFDFHHVGLALFDFVVQLGVGGKVGAIGKVEDIVKETSSSTAVSSRNSFVVSPVIVMLDWQSSPP